MSSILQNDDQVPGARNEQFYGAMAFEGPLDFSNRPVARECLPYNTHYVCNMHISYNIYIYQSCYTLYTLILHNITKITLFVFIF